MSWPSFLCALCAPLRHARLRPAPMAPPARKTPRLGKREILFRPAMLRPPPNPPPAGKTRQWGGGQRSQAKGQKPRNIQNGVWTTISQSMGNEMMEGIMRVKTLIYPRFPGWAGILSPEVGIGKDRRRQISVGQRNGPDCAIPSGWGYVHFGYQGCREAAPLATGWHPCRMRCGGNAENPGISVMGLDGGGAKCWRRIGNECEKRDLSGGVGGRCRCGMPCPEL